jgi:hypothetical protein
MLGVYMQCGLFPGPDAEFQSNRCDPRQFALLQKHTLEVLAAAGIELSCILFLSVTNLITRLVACSWRSSRAFNSLFAYAQGAAYCYVSNRRNCLAWFQ